MTQVVSLISVTAPFSPVTFTFGAVMSCIKAKFIDVSIYACTSCLRERCTVSMCVHRGVGRCDWKCVAH